MSNSLLLKNFESFAGIDYRSTPLTTSLNQAGIATNYLFSEGKSLRIRPGCQMKGQPGNFMGIHTYGYADSNTAEAKEELLAINDYLWKLVDYTFTITRTSTLGFTYFAGINTSSSHTNPAFTILESALPYTLDFDMGAGGGQFWPTVGDLCVAIDALANYVCSIPTRSAKVPSNQTAVRTITVNSGHTINAGDYVTFWDFASNKLVARQITAKTATTITFHANKAAVTVKAGQWLGLAAVPAGAVSFGYGVSPDNLTVTVPFHAWERIYLPEAIDDADQAPFAEHYSKYTANSSEFLPPYFLDAQDVCYIFWQTDGSNIARSSINGVTDPTAVGALEASGCVFKYDGQNVYRAGAPSTDNTIPGTTAGALPAGTYRYYIRARYQDFRGNLISGNAWWEDTPNGGSSYAVTLGSAGAIVVGVDPIDGTFADGGFGVKGGLKDTTETSTTIKMDDGAAGPPTIDVGDKIYFVNSLGTLEQRNVTAVNVTTAPYTITMDGSASTINDNTAISVGLLWEFFRTTNNGADYFQTKVLPNNMFASTAFTDATLDGTIIRNEELIVPDKGETLDEFSETQTPPRATMGCIHQGCLVYSGDVLNPNTIYYSEPGQLEYVPRAFNQLDVPPTSKGPITAVFSDSDSRLVVCKEHAVYAVIGDLQSGSYNTLTLTDGDFGISSHSSVCKIGNVHIGVGKLGFIAISNGSTSVSDYGLSNPAVLNARDLKVSEAVNLSGAAQINPAIWNNRNLKLRQTRAINDFTQRVLRTHIPATDQYAGDSTSHNSLLFARDLFNTSGWFDWDYGVFIEPDLGFAIKDDTTHFCSSIHDRALTATDLTPYRYYAGQLYVELNPDNFSTSVQLISAYYDHSTAVTVDLWLKPENLGEPSVKKVVLGARIFAYPGMWETAPATTAGIISVFYDGKAIDNLPGGALADGAFSFTLGSSGGASSGRLPSAACEFFVIRLQNVRFLSGIEILGKAPYRQERISP